MSSHEAEISRLVAAIPSEDEVLCPGCWLNIQVKPSERRRFLEKVALRSTTIEALSDGVTALPYDNNNRKISDRERTGAKCLLTRARGACLTYTPGVENE